MFAIAFDMDIKELRNTYGEPYNNAYYETAGSGESVTVTNYPGPRVTV